MALDEALKKRLNGLTIPQHVAIILDGNGRWAEKHGKSRLEGHTEGSYATRRAVQAGIDIGIETLSVYAFSTENWKRSQDEVGGLMELLEFTLRYELDYLKSQNIRLVFSGTLPQLPQTLQDLLVEVANDTRDNPGMKFNVCINYGGRAEITEAAVKLAKDALAGNVDLGAVTPEIFSTYLYHPDIADPDMVIRTGGDFRISNFLLWEVAYAEFISIPEYWPEFDTEKMVRAIEQFNGRDRRFGGRTKS